MSSRPRAPLLLLAGLALLVLSQMRWGLGALAWIAPAPLLASLRARGDRRFLWGFALSSVLAWIAATAKIATPPIPVLLIPVLYGVPLALFHLPPYLLWRRLASRGQDGAAIFGFAASAALLEWVQAEHTPLGTWGSAANTQVGQLPVLQLLSLVGSPGLSFVIFAAGAALEAAWAGRLGRRAVGGALALAILALSWGAVRAERPFAGPELRVAAVRTDAAFSGPPIPSAEERRQIVQTLLHRTTEAAVAGARLVVWPEVSTLALPEEEPALRAQLAQAAALHGVELIAGYIVPTSLEPLHYENKLVWAGPDGQERLTYHKLHPVPGEPATPGPAPAPVLRTALGALSVALCYDYDFPALARLHAQGGAGLVAVPSSDWRGIDPVHTEMAAMRAVEGGFSILRATRFGLSAGIDAHGRLRASHSTNETAEPFLLLSLPTSPIPTLYARLGNAVLLPLLGLLGWALWVGWSRGR